MKSRYVRIPERYRNLTWDELCAIVAATGEPDGQKQIDEMAEYMATCSCRGCARRKATATLRVWLTVRDERPAVSEAVQDPVAIVADPEPEPEPEPTEEDQPKANKAKKKAVKDAEND